MNNILDSHKIQTLVDSTWDRTILPTLKEYVRIPNKSPLYDPQWDQNGHMEKAVQLLAAWCREQPIRDMKLEIARLPGHDADQYGNCSVECERAPEPTPGRFAQHGCRDEHGGCDVGGRRPVGEGVREEGLDRDGNDEREREGEEKPSCSNC